MTRERKGFDLSLVSVDGYDDPPANDSHLQPMSFVHLKFRNAEGKEEIITIGVAKASVSIVTKRGVIY